MIKYTESNLIEIEKVQTANYNERRIKEKAETLVFMDVLVERAETILKDKSFTVYGRSTRWYGRSRKSIYFFISLTEEEGNKNLWIDDETRNYVSKKFEHYQVKMERWNKTTFTFTLTPLDSL